jgi:aminopeptidase N
MTLLAMLILLPTESYLFEQVEQVDVDGLVTRRDALRLRIAREHAPLWQRLYATHAAGPYQPDALGMARRALRNAALGYLAAATRGREHERLLLDHLEAADNLTDRMAALAAIANSVELAATVRADTLTAFHARWRHESLVVNQWFSVQAGARLADAEVVHELARHPDFDLRNPNRVRSVFGVFAQANARNFHAGDGSGYRLVADKVLELDGSNPQVAARLALPLTRWRKFDSSRSPQMRAELERIAAAPTLSTDVFEVATKGLV